MKTKLICCILFLGYVQMAFSYPIPSRNLRELITESQNIVYAKVTNIEVNKNDNSLDQSIATLEIEEVLQGKIYTKQILVYFSPNMICPAPANYIKGKTVLAFLNRYKNGYKTYALSYGVYYLTEHTFSVYKKRIFEYQCILGISNNGQRYAESIEWLKKCIMKPETRHQGVTDFRQSKNLGFQKDFNEGLKIELSQDQKIKLKTEFITAQKLNPDDIKLLPFIINGNEDDAEFQEFLFLQLKSPPKSYGIISILIMESLTNLTNREDLREIFSEINKLNCTNYRERKQKINIIRLKFIEQY